MILCTMLISLIFPNYFATWERYLSCTYDRHTFSSLGSTMFCSAHQYKCICTRINQLLRKFHVKTTRNNMMNFRVSHNKIIINYQLPIYSYNVYILYFSWKCCSKMYVRRILGVVTGPERKRNHGVDHSWASRIN